MKLTIACLPDSLDKLEELGGVVRNTVVRPGQVLHVRDVTFLLSLMEKRMTLVMGKNYFNYQTEIYICGTACHGMLR